MKRVIRVFLLLLFSLLAHNLTASDTDIFKQERQYEPVVVKGYTISAFNGVPIDEVYLYAYSNSEQKLKLIPFQIDERIKTELEMGFLEKTWEPRHYYANSGIGISDDGKIDEDDELVCLVRDLGPEAPESAWVGINVEGGLKKTISVWDPQNAAKYAVGYLVHSKEKKEIPSPYNFSYDVNNDIVKNNIYAVRMARPGGLIEDITFFSPYGNGKDIFDTQKIRLVGLIDLGIVAITPGLNGLPALNDRDNFHVFPPEDYLSVTQKPRVRIVREVHQTIRADEFLFSLAGISFFVTTKFYPYSGTLEGGASLNPDVLREMFGDADDIFIQFDLVRQSWDFNENAKGMKFYNANNNGLAVDGAADNGVNRNLTSVGRIHEWSMLSGEQGTFFAHITINDTTYQTAQLYYHDNQSGGQDDQSFIEGGDTGDAKSYGDNGVKILNSQSLDLGFTAYFVEKNKDKNFGALLAHNVENPVKIGSFPVGVKDKPDQQPVGYRLAQNYPNPFNGATVINFYLARATNARVDIFDLNGRLVKTLTDGLVNAGSHHVVWDGRDAANAEVSSGIYVYQLTTDEYQQAKKLLLVK